MNIAIDASRNKSGGGIVHMINILAYFETSKYQIDKIHLWAYDKLLDSIPDYPWLVKHRPVASNKSIIHQLVWQYFSLPKEIKDNDCKLLLSTDAGSVCRFAPYVTMSRDMLSFDRLEFRRYFFSLSWLRLYLLKFVQLSSFKNSSATIFLTEYAKKQIGTYQKLDYENIIINHGISDKFRINKVNKNNLKDESQIVLTYVSNADLYKHNWNVIEAVHNLRETSGLNFQLQLIGASEGHPKALRKIEDSLNRFDPKGKYTVITPRIVHEAIINYLHKTDLVIFASTCENMPNTLIEAMSTGLPIVCSSYGPMPEMIEDGTIYFDPEDAKSITSAISKMVFDDELRLSCANKSFRKSLNFSWERCSNETFEFLNKKILNEIN